MINAAKETYPQLPEIFFSYKIPALKPIVVYFMSNKLAILCE
jgi:hypothetical protein